MRAELAARGAARVSPETDQKRSPVVAVIKIWHYMAGVAKPPMARISMVWITVKG